MKIGPNKLATIFDQITMGGLIDPVRLTFNDNEVSVSQLDVTRTLGVIAKIDKVQFKDYEKIGPVLINSEITKRFSKFFKTDELIDISLASATLKATGSIETFEADLPVEEVPALETELKETENGTILGKPKVLASFYLDMNEIKSDYGEQRKLIFNSNGLFMNIEEDVFRYNKSIRVMKKALSQDGKVIANASILNTICNLCKGPAWLIFTEGPMQICYKEVGFQATYIIAPTVE